MRNSYGNLEVCCYHFQITCQFFANFPDGIHEQPLSEIVKQIQDKAAELVLTGKLVHA